MRVLSQLEQALTLSNQYYPLSAVFALRLENGPSEIALQSSIDSLQRQNPLLHAYIIEKDGNLSFVKDLQETKVPLKSIIRENGNQWLEIATKELNTEIAQDTPPLWRAIYLKSGSVSEKSEIILSFHHAIVDSTFLSSFINLLLTTAGEFKSDSANSSLIPPAKAIPSPLLTEVLPQKFKMPHLLLLLAPFVFRQLKNNRTYKKEIGSIKDSAIPVSSENSIYTLSFTEEDTVSLIKWSREHELSLNSILAACMLLIVNRHNYENKRKMLRTVHFANLRPFLNPPVAKDTAGCFISMMRYNIPLTQQSDISSVAKYLDNQFRQSTQRGEKFLFSLLSKILINKSLKAKKERLGATAFSYAGPVQLKNQYGHIQVSGLHGFITNNCLGPEISGFGKICFNRLSIDLNYLASETSKEKAILMAVELKANLLQLTQKQ